MKEKINYATGLVTAGNNIAVLSGNPYPGRGIVIGPGESGKDLQQVYWIMGRSANSQNRVFETSPDKETGNELVRTAPYDESKVEDSSLTIYNAMRSKHLVSNGHIVTNGHQTDSIVKSNNFFTTLKGWDYEPDAPNFTPRISAINVGQYAFGISIIRKHPSLEKAVWTNIVGSTRDMPDGVGLGLHTYLGDSDPLPSFDIDPYPLPLGETAEETAQNYWEKLNDDNKVAIVVKSIDVASGGIEHHIINRHQ